jgi:uncharacterized membrane protein
MAGIQREELLRYVLQTDESAEEEDMFELLVHEKVSQDVNHIHVDRQSFGDRMADKLAGFAGSWKFIIGFIVVLLSWIAVNAFLLSSPFDPFPFILLNLFLSCVAAIQAPVIMMSQNRQEEKDRLRAKNDYRVNLKSELIIEDLHRRLDALMQNQELILKRLDELEPRG